jgi:glutaminyl-peptide cyclotransferase
MYFLKKEVLSVYILCSLILVTIPIPTSGNIYELRESSVISELQILEFVVQQLNIGPRYPGSIGAELYKQWVKNYVNALPNWNYMEQIFEYDNISLSNFLITHEDTELFPKYLIGAHWDSRKKATKDPNPDFRFLPVPGANDGASGVAAIFELLRLLNGTSISDIGFVLFDAEDQGQDSGGYSIDSWDWIIGSTYFVNSFTLTELQTIQNFILLDMIGNKELQLPKERSSTQSLIDAVWEHAHSLGYGEIFLNQLGPSIIDDHRPFLARGVDAINIIDYNNFIDKHHTVYDDIDAISETSIAIVTDVVLDYIFAIESLSYSDLSTELTVSELSELSYIYPHELEETRRLFFPLYWLITFLLLTQIIRKKNKVIKN